MSISNKLERRDNDEGSCKTFAFKSSDQVNQTQFVFDTIAGDATARQIRKYPKFQYFDEIKYFSYVVVSDQEDRNKTIMGIVQLTERKYIRQVQHLFYQMGLYTHSFEKCRKPLVTAFLKQFLIKKAANISILKEKEYGEFNLGCGNVDLKSKIDENVKALNMNDWTRIMPKLEDNRYVEQYMDLTLFINDYFDVVNCKFDFNKYCDCF